MLHGALLDVVELTQAVTPLCQESVSLPRLSCVALSCGRSCDWRNIDSYAPLTRCAPMPKQNGSLSSNNNVASAITNA